LSSKEFYVGGAKGNDATCKAQGFFVQMGTIAAFLNVSLAAYYFCVIKLGWGELKVLDYRRWFFACPIVVGLVLAIVGILYYDMVRNPSPFFLLPLSCCVFDVLMLFHACNS
jgi:hypothetical protein